MGDGLSRGDPGSGLSPALVRIGWMVRWHVSYDSGEKPGRFFIFWGSERGGGLSTWDL